MIKTCFFDSNKKSRKKGCNNRSPLVCCHLLLNPHFPKDITHLIRILFNGFCRIGLLFENVLYYLLFSLFFKYNT